MKSHLTAIPRKTLPVPVKWLLENKLIRGHVLDYGCGKCKKINDIEFPKYEEIQSITSYDPYHEPIAPIEPNNYEGWYHVILCTYVLCTLPESEEKPLLKKIQRLLRQNGVAYIIVRNDTPKQGFGISSRKTLQRKVFIPYLYELKKCPQYRIYMLTAKNKIV